MSLPTAGFTEDDFASPASNEPPVTPAAFPLGPYRNLDYPHVFLSRTFIQTTLPHSRPSGSSFVRENRGVRVTLYSPDNNGLPYGTTPRLVLMWICTQVCALKTRNFEFPDSFYRFLRVVGVNVGARSADAARVQLEALFRMSFDVTMRPKNEPGLLRDQDALLAASRRFTISDDYTLWWHSKSRSAKFSVRLSERFYEYARESQVPLDWTIIRQLRSPLALDVYSWLVSRSHRTVKRREAGQPAEFIPWERLKFQFGAEYATVGEFARRFRQALEKVVQLYPVSRVCPERGGLTLAPFNVSVLPARQRREEPEQQTALLPL